MLTTQSFFKVLLLSFFLFVGQVCMAQIPIDPIPPKPKPTPNGGTTGGNTKVKNVKQPKPAREGKPMLSLQLGGGLQYYAGDLSNELFDFDSRALSPQFTGMLGYKYGRGQKPNTAGLFVTYGQYSEESAIRFDDVGAFPTTATGTFLEVEGGFMFWDLLRLSFGYGTSTFKDDESNQPNAPDLFADEYITATTGFSFGPKNVKFQLMNTLMLSQEQDKVNWRPSLGVVFKLDFLKRRF